MLLAGITLVYSNPMHLLINEYYVGQDGHGFIEIISKTNPAVYVNKPESYNPFQDYKLIIGKRRKYQAPNIKAIIDLSLMKFTKNEYLLITSQENQRIQNPDVNLMKIGSTIFSVGSNNQNILTLADDEVMVIYLCYGQFDRNLVIPPSGHTTHVELTEGLLTKMEQVIVDGLLFGNPKSSTPKKINSFMKKEKGGDQMKKRLLSDEALSFSRCTGSSNNLPFQSKAFKVNIDYM